MPRVFTEGIACRWRGPGAAGDRGHLRAAVRDPRAPAGLRRCCVMPAGRPRRGIGASKGPGLMAAALASASARRKQRFVHGRCDRIGQHAGMHTMGGTLSSRADFPACLACAVGLVCVCVCVCYSCVNRFSPEEYSMPTAGRGRGGRRGGSRCRWCQRFEPPSMQDFVFEVCLSVCFSRFRS